MNRGVYILRSRYSTSTLFILFPNHIPSPRYNHYSTFYPQRKFGLFLNFIYIDVCFFNSHKLQKRSFFTYQWKRSLSLCDKYFTFIYQFIYVYFYFKQASFALSFKLQDFVLCLAIFLKVNPRKHRNPEIWGSFFSINIKETLYLAKVKE